MKDCLLPEKQAAAYLRAEAIVRFYSMRRVNDAFYHTGEENIYYRSV